MKPKVRWTAADNRRLEQLFNLGCSDREIAASIGRAYYAVTAQRKRRGLRRRQQRSAGDLARARWGTPLPDWIAVLARACDLAGGRKAVAEQLGYTPATITSVLAANYDSPYTQFEARVRTRLMEFEGLSPPPPAAQKSRAGEHVKPRPLQRPETVAALRRCLSCGEDFLSAGIGNRMCGRCKDQLAGAMA